MSGIKQATVSVLKKANASIDPNRCANCGQCREYCPVDAISEKQKEICHMCPDCTEMKAVTVDTMRAMQNESCTQACPLGISPQGYIQLMKAGKQREAFELILSKNPLPAVCGYVCHHPCQQACKRGDLVDRPIEIRALKRFLGEEFEGYELSEYPVINPERIAVIGAGPAGLTAAHWLSRKGYKVTVFEQNAEPGGMLLRGIPEFRLDKSAVRGEIRRMEEAGLEICCNVKAGKDPSFADLLNRFDRVVVAAGTQISKPLPVEGWRTEGVLLAVNLMEKVNAGNFVPLSGNVVVVGGGSVAVDVARTALRLGAETVKILCLECGQAVPAHSWELREAAEEGIELIGGVCPVRFVGQTSRLEGVEYVRIENLDPKTFAYDTIAGSEAVLPADFCILAIGQKSDLTWPDDPRIIAAGDIASGKCSVIDAMASGREAAVKIDNELRGREYKEYQESHPVLPGDRAYKIYPALRAKLNFPDLPIQDAQTRLGNFDPVEFSLDGERAYLETLRCLACGYHAVDPDKCIGCGVCQKVCPKGDVITMVAVALEKEAQ